MSIDEYVNGFGEQGSQEEKEIEVVRNPRVDEICRRYEGWISRLIAHDKDIIYHKALEFIKSLQPTAQDIKEFSLQLKQYESIKKCFFITGFFLSALVNHSKESTFKIVTELLDERVNCLGYELSDQKCIYVKGDVGDNIGEEMKRGFIHIMGNTEDRAGFNMQDGIIIIERNAKKNSGIHMQGGHILIKGNAGEDLGKNMIGGRIEVNGEIGYISEDCRGEIYHRGKRIR